MSTAVRRHRGLRASAAALVVVAGLAACSSPRSTRLGWSAEPTGVFGAGEIRILDVARTASGWIAVGSTAAPQQAPGVWSSPDLSSWTRVAVAPVSFYGGRDELSTVAAGPRGAAAVGADPGGAHDNPRVATWYLDGDRLVEVPALFELFGGERQGSVDQIAFGPAGYVIIGDRTDQNGRFGATAWSSADGRTAFVIHDADPALESGPTETIDALGVAGGPHGYLAVGERFGAPGPTTDGIVWSSSDGRTWARLPSAALGGTGDQLIQRAVAWKGGWVLAGTDTIGGDTSIVAWSTSDARHWRETTILDTRRDDPTTAITDLAVTGRRVVLAGRAAGHAILASTSDGRRWSRLSVPATLTTDTHLHVTVAGDGTTLLVGATGGGTTQLWISRNAPA